MNGGENTLVLIVGDESDSETLGSETTSTSVKRTKRNQSLVAVSSEKGKCNVPDSVKVRISISRSIVVDNDVYSLNIDTTTENVGSNQNSLLERLELLVSTDTLFLRKTRVNGDRREVALSEESVEFGCARN